jgi:hypothetical protein
MLVQVGQCIFDDEQLKVSHGFIDLDDIGKEAFVNHIHFSEGDSEQDAEDKINVWVSEMKENWPNRLFKIYRHRQDSEVTIRFHLARKDEADWCEPCVEIEIIQVRT